MSTALKKDAWKLVSLESDGLSGTVSLSGRLGRRRVTVAEEFQGQDNLYCCRPCCLASPSERAVGCCIAQLCMC